MQPVTHVPWANVNDSTMKAALAYNSSSPSSTLPLKHQLSSKPELFANLPPSHSFKLQVLRKQRQQCKNRCVALRLAAAEILQADQIVNAEEEEEWLKTGKSKDKCKERKGIVELLECLEREAIMGDDEGKEPTDYNRRAQIFDKSSTVFQALKLKDPTSFLH